MNKQEFKRLISFDSQHKDKVECVTISPDNKFLASSSYKELKIWNMEDYSFFKDLNKI